MHVPGRCTVTRLRAAVGSAAFFVLAPGVVAGLVPRWITGWRLPPAVEGGWALRVLGGLLVLAGTAALVAEFVRFVVHGIGTPAPLAPTRRLVVGGSYRVVRNPMYLFVVAILAGQALVFASPALAGYAAGVAAVMVAFAHWWEQPHLLARFGEDYAAYRDRVPGWIPRIRRRRR